MKWTLGKLKTLPVFAIFITFEECYVKDQPCQKAEESCSNNHMGKATLPRHAWSKFLAVRNSPLSNANHPEANSLLGFRVKMSVVGPSIYLPYKAHIFVVAVAPEMHNI